VIVKTLNWRTYDLLQQDPSVVGHFQSCPFNPICIVNQLAQKQPAANTNSYNIQSSMLVDMNKLNGLISTKYLFLTLVCSIFIGEMLIMFLLNFLPQLSPWQGALLDATLLSGFSLPVIYFLAFRPLNIQIAKQKETEKELFESNLKRQNNENELEIKNNELQCTYIELMQSHDLFSHLFDFAPVGYFVLSDNGVITTSNMTAAKLFKMDKGKLIGRNIESFLSQEECEHWQGYYLKILQHDNKQSCKLVIQRDDGSSFYALFDCQRNNTLISNTIRVSFTDITMHNWTSFE
jgi:PAS domain S-box-containing protein